MILKNLDNSFQTDPQQPDLNDFSTNVNSNINILSQHHKYGTVALKRAGENTVSASELKDWNSIELTDNNGRPLFHNT